MTHVFGSTPRTSPEHSAWQIVGEVTLPPGFSPRNSRLPALMVVIDELKLSPGRQRQVERAVCDAVRNAWESVKTLEQPEFLSIRVFTQKNQKLPSNPTGSQELPNEENLSASWGFFLISNLDLDSNSTDIQRSVDLFLYPEG